MSEEDSLPTSYKYAWSANSELSLSEFLAKFKPSMVQNDGTKPWIWARGAENPKENEAGVVKAVLEANNLLMQVTEKVESIKNDDIIPVRSNKKTGAKSKKEVREQVQAEATENLKSIALKHGYLGGKWLIFAPAHKIDLIWSGIATSLVAGPLKATPAYLTKVSTSSEDEHSNAPQQHLICVYIPNVYDKDAVTEVMRVLLRSHGVNLSGVKSDLYTVIGLDSKHPSGIPSTVWKNTAILPEKEIKELKDAFFAEVAPKPVADSAVTRKTDESTDLATAGSTEKAAKAKPKLKRKAQNDDPFTSDDEQPEKEEEKLKAASSSKGKKPAVPKPKPDDFEDDDEDQEEEEQRKKKLTAKKQPTKRAKVDDDDDIDEDEGERPRKKRTIKK